MHNQLMYNIQQSDKIRKLEEANAELLTALTALIDATYPHKLGIKKINVRKNEHYSLINARAYADKVVNKQANA